MAVAAFAAGVGEERMHDSIQGRHESGSFLKNACQDLVAGADATRWTHIQFPSHNLNASPGVLALHRSQPRLGG